MVETDQPGFWRLSNPIMWACAATLGFAALIVWFGLASTCNNELFPNGDCPPKWQHLYAAPPNEVGDTLAGLAGVLAFIWLIATVLLQSIELREQRRVLTLQKEEMREQRKAAQDMAEALALQTDLLLEAGKARKSQDAKKEFDQLIEWAIERFTISERGLDWWLVKSKGSQMNVQTGASEPIEVEQPLNHGPIFHGSSLGEDVLRLTNTLDAMHSTLVLGERPVLSKSNSRPVFVEFYAMLNAAMSILPRLSDVDKLWTRERGIEAAVTKLSEVLQADVWVEPQ